MACPNCFNPETWDFNNGKPFTTETIDTICKELQKPYIKGLTITGGNPLEKQNLYDVYRLVSAVYAIYEGSKDIWVYTGFTWEELVKMCEEEINFAKWGDTLLLNSILNRTDVLVDGRYIDELNDVKFPYRGSTNQRLIKARESMANDKLILYDLEE